MRTKIIAMILVIALALSLVGCGSSGGSSDGKVNLTFQIWDVAQKAGMEAMCAAYSEKNPNVTIELSAHCDYKGSEAYNQRLSQRRAEAVVQYLIAHGIAADRLSPVGYGKGKPKTVKKKLTEKYGWLKEGDVLTEDFIKKLKKDQQEICNQLNRRTEFIVLRTTYGMFDEHGKLKEQPKPKPEEKKETGDQDEYDIYF